MVKLVAFRVDGSAQIGLGHIMRCLTLADCLSDHGHRVVFVCREHEGASSLIAERGYLSLGIPTPSGRLQERADSRKTLAVLRSNDLDPDIVVVDHYELGRVWCEPFMASTKVCVIDDLADRHHECHLLLDQNYAPHYRSRYDSLVPHGCVKLLGPRYILLRPDFAKYRNLVTTRKVVKKISICMGGADPDNLTAHALRATRLFMPEVEIDVIVGGVNPHKSLVEGLAQEFGASFFYQTSNMAQLMSEADLAIGAGGSMSWERISLGLPSLALVIADNQLSVADALRDAGLQFTIDVRAGFSHAVFLEQLRRVVDRLADVSENCLAFLDAGGVDRVVQRILDGEN